MIIETSPLQSKSITGFYMSETSVIKKLIPFWLCSCFPPLPLQESTRRPLVLWFSVRKGEHWPEMYQIFSTLAENF